MSWFRCLIEGQNFPGFLIGEIEPIGFFATRYVVAESPNQAKIEVLALLRNDSSLQVPPDLSKPKEAQIFFERIEEVDQSDVPENSQGFTFFMMGD